MLHDFWNWISSNLSSFIAAVSAMIAAITALFGVLTYRRNVRVRTSEFLSELHQAFFVGETYKKVRNQLDQSSAETNQTISKLIAEETAEFTDFLNFFELAAYFYRSRTLSRAALEALLGYYLKLLNRNEKLRGYIAKKENDFENLDYLLTKLGKNRRL